MLSYELIRSKRKTLAIHITSRAKVIVRAPLGLCLKSIEQVIMQKEKWIRTKIHEIEKTMQTKTEFSLEQGSTLPFLGNDYPVKQSTKLFFDGSCFYIPQVDFETLKPKLIALYKKLILDIIIKKVAYYADILQVTPSSVKITSATKRWGSCSHKNSLNFSFMLAYAEESAIDYVVVHELAHIKQHNHSSQFWAVVCQAMPDYKQRKQQLIKLQSKMNHLF